MPAYHVKGRELGAVVPVAPFLIEIHLQKFVENHLERLFDLRFVAGQLAGSLGRPDTVALDRAGNPVVIEYKIRFDRGVVRQGLDYRDALETDSRIEEAVAAKLGPRAKIRWGSTRLLIIAPAFSDAHILQARKARRVELWRFQKFEGILLLEDWLHHSSVDEAALRSHTVKVGDRDVAAAFMDIREHLLNHLDVTESIGKSAISYKRRGRGLVRFKFQGGVAVTEVADAGATLAAGWRDLGSIQTYRWQFRIVAPTTGQVSTKPITDQVDLVVGSGDSNTEEAAT